MGRASLVNRVALVAGATRGAGRAIAVELARAGAFVYATGRSTRAGGSEIDRPETIEGTRELIETAGGAGRALRVDHGEPDEVKALLERITSEHGRLDVLVNDIFGGDRYLEFDKRLWQHNLDGGLRMLRMGIETHAITSHYALPLLIDGPGGLVVEMTDGTAEYNAAYRSQVGFFYDLVKSAVQRMTMAQAHELRPYACAAIAVTPGWLRSEAMLENFGVSEQNWREGTAVQPHFCISESPTYVARGVTALASDPEVGRWSGDVLSSGYLASVYGFTDVDGTRPDCWRYITEVQDMNLPADDSGYR